MGSRDKILKNIMVNKPILKSKIELLPFFIHENENLVDGFCSNLEVNDGTYKIINSKEELDELLIEEIGDKSFVSLIESAKIKQNFQTSWLENPKDLINTKLLIICGKIGVVENGAIWIDDSTIHNLRVLPFIVERTIFIIHQKDLVPTMHHAYLALEGLNTGFGTFVAGPSKTGDVEQNLIIGAHGPLSHLVVIVH
tara:strand:- start:12229 stop:12819 length:591 start_codon:yes stop_codon:yes gene_type:complete